MSRSRVQVPSPAPSPHHDSDPVLTAGSCSRGVACATAAPPSAVAGEDRHGVLFAHRGTDGGEVVRGGDTAASSSGAGNSGCGGSVRSGAGCRGSRIGRGTWGCRAPAGCGLAGRRPHGRCGAPHGASRPSGPGRSTALVVAAAHDHVAVERRTRCRRGCRARAAAPMIPPATSSRAPRWSCRGRCGARRPTGRGTTTPMSHRSRDRRRPLCSRRSNLP